MSALGCRSLESAADMGLVGRRRAVATSCVLLTLALVVLDAAMANVALPEIAHSLSVSPAESVGVVTVYQAALVMTLLPWSALGESWGYKRVYALGIALFAFGSAASALSPSLAYLVVARFIQGLGGAAILALGVALLRFIVGERELVKAIGWNTLVVALATAAGPALGVLVLSNSSWRWLFSINVLLGTLVLLGTRALPNVAGTARKLDLGSIALTTAGFAAILTGAELTPRHAPAAITLLAGGSGALFALVRRELSKPSPLLPLDLLRMPSFRVSVLASVCAFVGQSVAFVSLPFYLQHSLGRDLFETGFLMTPWPLTVALVGPFAGQLGSRLSGAALCLLGGVVLSVGLAGAALLPLDDMPLALVPCLSLSGLGFGLFQISNNRNLFLAAPRARSGAAGGVQGTARLTGQAVGSAAVSALLTSLSLDVAPRVGLAFAAVMTLVAGLVSLRRAAKSG